MQFINKNIIQTECSNCTDTFSVLVRDTAGKAWSDTFKCPKCSTPVFVYEIKKFLKQHEVNILAENEYPTGTGMPVVQ